MLAARSSGTVRVLLASGVLFPMCGAAYATDATTFRPDVIHSFGAPVYGLECGEFDPSHNGPEIAVLVGDGSVWQVSPRDDWRLARIGQVQLLMDVPSMHIRSTIAIGNVISKESPGNELVASIGDTLTAYQRQADGTWTVHPLEDGALELNLGWGARIGDLDPTHPGEEVVYIREGFLDSSGAMLYSETNGMWDKVMIYFDFVGMDSIVVDLDKTSPGNELVITTEFGPTYLVRQPPAAGRLDLWPRETLWDDEPNSGWVLDFADVDPTLPGSELVYGTRYNNSVAISTPNADGGHDLIPLYQGDPVSRTMWDIAVAPLVGDDLAPEIVGVDGRGVTHLVERRAGAWTGREIYEHPSPLNVVVAGALDADAATEILVGSQTGELIRLTATVNLAGDLNCDGVVSVGDINPFVLALTDPVEYAIQFPDCDLAAGDCSDDGQLTVGDINCFVALVTGG